MKDKKTQKLFTKPAPAPKAPPKVPAGKQPPKQGKPAPKKKDDGAKAKNNNPQAAPRPQGGQKQQQAGQKQQDSKNPQGQAPKQGKSNKRRRPAYKPGYQKKNQGRNKPQDDAYSNLPSGKNIVTKRPVWESDNGDEGDNPPQNTENNSRARSGRNNSNIAANRDNPRLDNSISKAIQRAKLPEGPKNDKMIYDFSENELKEDTAIKVINRSSNGEIKYSSFEDYLDKTQGEN